MTQDDIPTPRSRRRQFTLRSLFRLMAVLTIIASWWISFRLFRENQNLRQENIRLWGEVGELHMAEGTEDKLQAIGVPTTDDMVWKWRVHVPNRQNIFLTVHSGKITEEIPQRISGTTLFPGEYLVTAAFRKDHQDRWQWLVKEERADEQRGASSSFSIYASDEQIKLIQSGHSTRTSYIGNAISLAEPGKPLALLRYRVFATEPTRTIEREPAEGVLVWICEGDPSN
jgi:hypothetical protein